MIPDGLGDVVANVIVDGDFHVIHSELFLGTEDGLALEHHAGVYPI